MTQPSMSARRPANRGPKAAAHNRAALVAAAREIFAVQGLDAPLSLIARRAGVGQGVLYRHFPDRGALAAAVLEKNVREIEAAAAADGATIAATLGVVTWHITQSAAFIRLLHAEGTRPDNQQWLSHLSDRVENALRRCLPDGYRLGVDDLTLAVSMVSGAAAGPTPQQRERRALAAWRLLGVTVGPVRPFDTD